MQMASYTSHPRSGNNNIETGTTLQPVHGSENRNNRKYVIITPNLSNMGGAQMYIRNKLIYLRENGWDVDIICGMNKNAVIPEFKEYSDIYPEILFPQHYYSVKYTFRPEKSQSKHKGNANPAALLLRPRVRGRPWTQTAALLFLRAVHLRSFADARGRQTPQRTAITPLPGASQTPAGSSAGLSSPLRDASAPDTRCAARSVPQTPPAIPFRKENPRTPDSRYGSDAP